MPRTDRILVYLGQRASYYQRLVNVAERIGAIEVVEEFQQDADDYFIALNDYELLVQ